MSSFHFNILNYIWIGVGLITFAILIYTRIRAPYGRHATAGWGKTIANKWGWFWMEVPAFLIFPLMVILGSREKDILSWVLVVLWALHYFNRTFIYPFRIKTKGKRMPLLIVFSALFFNVINGFLNGHYLGVIAPPDQGIDNWNVILGIGLFTIGFWINQTADSKLISLRYNSTEYQIPNGWLFQHISCPNHFGEIILWIGFATAAWNLPALAFAVWTICNLVPRAINHHEWYRENFSEYPGNRKAIIPFFY